MRYAGMVIGVLVAGCASEPSVTLVATPDTVVFAGFASTPGAQTLQLSSPADTVAWSATSDAAWLSIFPSSGAATPALLTMTANVAGLGGGTFRGTLRVTVTNGALDVPLRLEVPAMSGTWTGTVPDNIGLELFLTDSGGVISGTGAFVGSSGARVPLNIAGTHAHPAVIFSLNAQLFQPATVSGAFVAAGSIAATLTGSSYVGQAITLTKQ